MKKILILLFISQSIFAQNYDFAIYNDGDVGAWEDGIIAFEHFLDWKGISHNRVTAQDINTIILKDIYTAIFFPGGDADYYNAAINAIGIQHIQDLISDNGAYIGMCAGAEFACDKLVWQGTVIDYPLDLFQGEAVGPIDDLAVWPDSTMTTLTMNTSDEINLFEPENEDMLYWGGTVFNAYSGVNVAVVATYDAYFNNPAIIKFNYGSGRVLLISPHPEIEEDSTRDGVNVAESYDDNGSDWNFLWTATDWLLGNALTDPNALTIVNPDSNDFKIYPNPVNSIMTISLEDLSKIKKTTIYNQLGQELFSTKISSNSFDLTTFKDGIYILEIELENTKIKKKLIVKH